MGFLSLFGGTVIIDALTGKVIDGAAAKPEWWVEVSKTLDQGTYEKAQRFLVGKMGVESRADAPDDAMLKQETDLVSYQRELVTAALVDWNLTDLDDERLPLANYEDRKRSVAKLPPAVFMTIYQVVAKLNGPKDAKETATFPDGARAVDQNGSEATPDPVAVLDRGGALEEVGAQT